MSFQATENFISVVPVYPFAPAQSLQIFPHFLSSLFCPDTLKLWGNDNQPPQSHTLHVRPAAAAAGDFGKEIISVLSQIYL